MIRLPLATSAITSITSARTASSIPRCFTASRWKRTQTLQLLIAETTKAMIFFVFKSTLPGPIACL